MPDQPKSPWPTTYLGRLHAVTEELREIGAPTSVTTLAQRFAGVTTEEVESILAALVLFGRVEKVGENFEALDEAEQ
ncbi:MAG TPA: hypothetical protein VGM54_02950 [Chthoniobacter sp.]|jgi:hypothetical protein